MRLCACGFISFFVSVESTCILFGGFILGECDTSSLKKKKGGGGGGGGGGGM